ncbi:MAG: magnesium transporter [Planctomycetia bacterium]|nr:magnesium transporter [Planctomycetia bacterium]
MLKSTGLHDSVEDGMHRDYTRLRVDQTVGEALAAVHAEKPQSRIIYFYVVDADGRLAGVIPTRRLLLSDAATRLADIMVENVIAIPRAATVLEACEFFLMHRLLAFPVVDADRRIVGVVDIDLYTDELAELDRSARQEDVFQMIGVHVAEAQQASAAAAFAGRFPWLLANIGGGILAALLSKLFEAQLQQTVALALFMPVVLALAESVSIQSVTLAIAMLHGQTPRWASLATKLRRELATGVLLGGACGALVAVVALVWLGQPRFALALMGGIAGGVACAATIGLAMPNLLRMARRDPQVAAGPIALAIADMATLLIYFNLARWLLG